MRLRRVRWLLSLACGARPPARGPRRGSAGATGDRRAAVAPGSSAASDRGRARRPSGQDLGVDAIGPGQASGLHGRTAAPASARRLTSKAGQRRGDRSVPLVACPERRSNQSFATQSLATQGRPGVSSAPIIPHPGQTRAPVLRFRLALMPLLLPSAFSQADVATPSRGGSGAGWSVGPRAWGDTLFRRSGLDQGLGPSGGARGVGALPWEAGACRASPGNRMGR